MRKVAKVCAWLAIITFVYPNLDEVVVDCGNENDVDIETEIDVDIETEIEDEDLSNDSASFFPCWRDTDNDGWAVWAGYDYCRDADDITFRGSDCDDTNPDTNPDASEICDDNINQ